MKTRIARKVALKDFTKGIRQPSPYKGKTLKSAWKKVINRIHEDKR